MIGPPISEISSTNAVKKLDTSVQLERLALCPAHSGRRSDRPAASAGIARLLTSLRCNGYGRIAVPSLVQLLQQTVVDSPRKSSGEALCQSRVPCLFSSQSLAMKEAGAGLLARQEYRSHLHALCTKSQGSNYAARICDATCSDYGHFDLVGNLRNERQRASE